jgi:tetratricopeptide (TPR) repeat protein
MRGGRRQRRRLRSLVGFVDLLYRQGRSPPSGFEALVEKLRRMDLVDRETVELARREAQRMVAGGSLEQLDLFAPDIGVSPEVRLLALCCNGYGKEAAVSARELLRFGQDTAFSHVILAYLLEKQGSTREALATIEEELASHPQPWLQLERARLRSALGDDADDIRDDLAPLSQFDSLPPAELAAAVAELARGGREDFRAMLQRLLHKTRKKAPEELTVVLADSEIELSLGHHEKALASFREAVTISSRDATGESRGAVLEAALELAAAALTQETPVRESLANEILEILATSGLAEEWLPLSHVLASLGGESNRSQRLSPEMRALTESVFARIRKIGAPSPAIVAEDQPVRGP